MVNLYLDHVLIAVRDLRKARATYSQSLGFTLTPEGVHPGRGTHNSLVVFGPEYLELIAVRDHNEARNDRPHFTHFLGLREGLYMFALGTSNLDDAISEVRKRGGRVSDPVDGSRTGSDGRGGYSWRSAYLDPKGMPGSLAFIIQHHQTVGERYTEPARPTVHRNGITGIHTLSLAVKNAQVAAQVWCRTLGLPPGKPRLDKVNQLRAVRVKLANCFLEFVSPAGQSPVLGHLEAHGESPYRLSLKVPRLALAAVQLKSWGVVLGEERVTREDSRLSLPEDQAEGVSLELVQPG